MAEEASENPAAEAPPPAPAGTAVAVETTATAEVNPPDNVTLWSRASGVQLPPVPRADAAALMAANPDLTYVRYDLDASADDFVISYRAVEEAVLAMIEAYRRLGYVSEATEAASNAAWGAAVSAYRVLSLAMGANLPNEAEVAAWAEHRAQEGGFDLEQFPNLHRAAAFAAAIDAYEAEKGAAHANA